MNLIELIYNSLKAELEITEGERFNSTLLRSKVENAYRDVKAARKYPTHYTEAVIEHDMDNYYSQIRAIAMYDYSIVGVEALSSFSEDGVSNHMVDRNSLFNGVLPIAKRG